jgi:hypothetical protein
VASPSKRVRGARCAHVPTGCFSGVSHVRAVEHERPEEPPFALVAITAQCASVCVRGASSFCSVSNINKHQNSWLLRETTATRTRLVLFVAGLLRRGSCARPPPQAPSSSPAGRSLTRDRAQSPCIANQLPSRAQTITALCCQQNGHWPNALPVIVPFVSLAVNVRTRHHQCLYRSCVAVRC